MTKKKVTKTKKSGSKDDCPDNVCPINKKKKTTKKASIKLFTENENENEDVKPQASSESNSWVHKILKRLGL